MNKYKLSICIPTYNRATTLDVTLKSIAMQLKEHRNEVEVCISDNASTDNTGEIVEKYKELINISYFRHPVGIHCFLNWDYTVSRMSCGEYILIIGDDDIFINDGINRIFSMLNDYPSDYYYLNHIHGQVQDNEKAVIDNNCIVEYSPIDCEVYSQESRYIEKWEHILNMPGKDQEVNMLFLGNHLMKRSVWNVSDDLRGEMERLFDKHKGQTLSADSLEYVYSFWSPQLTLVAKSMIGKRCFYSASPIICQGMGANTSDIYQVAMLIFLPRWIQLFRSLYMDLNEMKLYEKYIADRCIYRFCNMMKYKKHLLVEHPYAYEFISFFGFERTLPVILDRFQDIETDYYFRFSQIECEKKLKEICSDREKKVVLWGTGDVAVTYIKNSPTMRAVINYVVDGNMTKHGTTFECNGLTINSPETLKGKDVSVVIIASLKYEEEIRQTLKRIRCNTKYIIDSKGINEYLEKEQR